MAADVDMATMQNNATTKTAWTGNMLPVPATGQVASAALAYIIRISIFFALNVINLSGNVFTLVTIRLTPRLWTTTNYILASMMFADSITAVNTTWLSLIYLILLLRGNLCEYIVLWSALTPIMKTTGYVSMWHMNLICIDRYIAIVHPLHYATKLSERNLKWIIAALWVLGIVVTGTFALWFIGADATTCVIIPEQYHLLDPLVSYLPACISMVFCYGKILAIALRQRRLMKRVEPLAWHAGPRNSAQPATSLPSVQVNAPVGSNDTPNPQRKSAAGAADPAEQREKIKSQKRQFKAVYLTVTIVGSFVVLWFPHELGRVLSSLGAQTVATSYIALIGTSIGAANFAFSWVIYAGVSKSYRRAYRQVLIRYGCCGCANIAPPSNITDISSAPTRAVGLVADRYNQRR